MWVDSFKILHITPYIHILVIMRVNLIMYISVVCV